MKILHALSILLVTFVLTAPEPARATGTLAVAGRWAGTGFASAIDLDGDGIPARTFYFKALGQPLFAAIEGVVDASVVGFPGACPPGSVELAPLGQVTWRAPNGDALYVAVSPTPHLCFDPAAPDEVIGLTITGGTGAYAGRTGTGTAHIHDAVLLARAGDGAPLMVDSRGEFSLSIR